MTGVLLKDRLYHFRNDMEDAFDSIFAPIAETEGLTQAQAQLLFELSGHDGELTVGRIRCLRGQSSGNRSTLCKRMEQRGYLARQRSCADERCVVLHLTAQGWETVRRMEAHLEKRCAPFLGSMTEADAQKLQESIDILSGWIGTLVACMSERIDQNDKEKQ
ncbi:MarR family winged helix-turn-helix transcriptional regulator [Intestinibacillus massiliensis]|uniref:MarR family winged helix-turn-helix transcriptional regulator n=1 Tax=Intestinibacillus massiliensis TaxID=1871029 RepID=UPI0013567211|nr:MarR family winged helix-turn-helix transcriptional regulator [Intestinibacillus massiliensis]